MKSVRRLVLISLAICASFATVSDRSFAQASPSVPVASFTDLATAIKSSFPLPGDAYAGRDWCLQTESDANTNWWYLKFSKQLYAWRVAYAKRIRLSYLQITIKNAQKSYEKAGFASMFLGMDLRQVYPYANVEALEKSPIPRPDSVELPHWPDSACPDLASVLPIMFIDDAEFWAPLGNPLCTDDCKKIDLGNGLMLPEKQISDKFGSTSPENLLHWNFNDHDHAIPGAMRFLVEFCSATCSDVKATVTGYGYLVVGFGGSGGAG